MITRFEYGLVGGAGLFIVIGLLVIGVDVVRASRKGPHWARRVLGAGLVVLSAMGVYYRNDLHEYLCDRLSHSTCYATMEAIPYEELDPGTKIRVLSDRMEAIDKAISAS